VPELIWAESVAECRLWLNHLDLLPFAPFTVLFVEPNRPAIVAEWDGRKTIVHHSGDSYMPLTSSSCSPENARTTRLKELVRHATDAGQIDATVLQRFHSSHGEEASANSPCMHRADAETVSFSWVTVTDDEIRFIYVAGPPCLGGKREQHALRRAA
jgi:hypothetical protein